MLVCAGSADERQLCMVSKRRGMEWKLEAALLNETLFKGFQSGAWPVDHNTSFQPSRVEIGLEPDPKPPALPIPITAGCSLGLARHLPAGTTWEADILYADGSGWLVMVADITSGLQIF